MRQTSASKQYRALTIAVIIAVVFSIIFFRPFFSAIVFAIITAYLFNPLYIWFIRHVKSNATAASLTLLVAVIIMLIPVALIGIFTLIQVNHLINYLNTATINVGLDELGQHVLNSINALLAHLPGDHQVTTAEFNSAIQKAIQSIASFLVGFISSAITSISGAITAIFIYAYSFVNILANKDYLVSLIQRLNPLGSTMTDRYLDKMGAMTAAMARGQFIIAICQGTACALILTLAGIDNLFFFFFVLLSILSIIPLGAGIVTIPIGIVMMLTGNFWGGLLVVAGHLLLVTNIDNILRPKLVPKSIRLNPALTLLAVFSGIAMFGFLGIIIGPVLMIVIKLTIEAYIEATSTNAKTSKEA